MTTQHLTIKPLAMTDTDLIYPLTSDCEITKYMRFSVHQHMDETKAMIENYIKNSYAFSLTETASGGFVGVFVLKRDEEAAALSITTFLNKEFFQKGYATEALAAMIRFSKEYLFAKKLKAYIVQENTASCRVVEKNGFTLHHTLTFPDMPCPLLVYELGLEG